MARIETSKKTKSTLYIYFGLLLAFILIVTSLIVLLFPFPSNEKTTYTNMKYPIVTNGEIYMDEAIYENGTVYFPLSYIQDTLDDGLLIDDKTKSIILTTSSKVYQIPVDSLTYYANEESLVIDYPIYKKIGSIPYISIDPFQLHYQVQYQFNQETGITVVRKTGETVLTGRVKEEQKEPHLLVRSEATLTSPFVDSLQANETVFIEDDLKDYYYIRKDNGNAGYVKKNIVVINEPITLDIENPDKTYVGVQAPTLPINLTWEAVYTKNPDTNKLPELTGVNVISPTWFSLKNNEGDLNNLGSTDFSKWAKSRNYEVWGLFSNDFDPDKTHEAFKDFETRKKIIQQLLEYSAMYQLDGINIDIENVYEEDGYLVTQFVKEATPYLHDAGLVVSMDVTFISDNSTWSKFYDREKLISVVDYMIVMAYDEHWSKSPIAGSVASLPWVESNLQRMLEIVPNNKLVLGVPLYTRLWKETEIEGGKIEVTSSAYRMADIEQWMVEHNVTPIYDDASGQNYVEYHNGEERATYKVWLEDEQSLQKRIDLFHKYELAGVASWSRYFANERAWTTISQSIEETEVVNK